jgi:hypothetical protein
MGIAKKLDCQPGDGIINAPDTNQECAVNVFSFFRLCAANGLCTIIASFDGNTGSGENYHDEANPLGENAWICAAWDAGTGQTFYVFFQWCDSEAPGTGGGAPWYLDASISSSTDGLGFSMAVTESGVSPWNGTTNDDGADTKGTPVWVDNGSTVHTFPRSNSTGGSFNTNKQNSAKWMDQSSTVRSRMHMCANENTLYFLSDVGDDGLYTTYVAMGRYTPASNTAAVLTCPYFMIAEDNGSGYWDLGSGQVYGGTVGNATQNGGVLALPVNSVMDCTLSSPSSGQISTLYQPNNMMDPNEYEPSPLSILAHESGKTAGPSGTGDFGFLGFMDIEILAAIYNSQNHQTNAAGTLAYIGSTTTAARKACFPWDAGALPGVEILRGGRESYTA